MVSFELTRGRLLARNTLWNLLGTGAPALVALFAIPVLVRHIGVSRFGLLTLIWTVVGYFSLFDLGLGATLTRMVADRLGTGKTNEIPSLVWTSLTLMLGLSVIGTIALASLSSTLVQRVLKVPLALQHESLGAFLLLAGCLPFMITTTGLRGVLEAQQRFGIVNAIRIPTNAFTFVGPLAVLPFSDSLVPIVAVLAAGRILAWLTYLCSALNSMPSLRSTWGFDGEQVGYVLRFGTWMTVSNVISPLMFYIDRMLIGAMVSVAAVAYYATPFEVVSRLLTIPSALAGVLFPAFTVSFAGNRQRAAFLLDRGQKYVFLVIFPIVLTIVTMADDGLRIWLGAEFARNSATVLQLLAVGVFFNSLAVLPWVLIQGAGRPDLTAKFHIIELTLYLPILWFMVKYYGVKGAAVAWTIRVLLDALALLLAAQRFLRREHSYVLRTISVIVGVSGIFFLATFPSTLSQRVGFLLVALFALVVTALFTLLPEEKHWLQLAFANRTSDPETSETI
jgi:O-antigen/teichoic acid export membrane protein